MPTLGRKKSNAIPDEKKFDGQGLDFKSKLIGILDVEEPRGDELSQSVITELKATALKNNKEKKEHKQKIIINITIKGIRLIDEATERIDHAHPIHRISFISHDKDDKRTFGYIVGTKEGYKLFALKTQKEAEVITQALKDLFEEVFRRHRVAKGEIDEIKEEVAEEAAAGEENKENENTNAQIEVAEDVLEKNADLLYDQLNDQLESMQKMDAFGRADSIDMFSDSFRPTAGEEFQAAATTDDTRNRASSVEITSLPTPEQLKRNPPTTGNANSGADLFSVDVPAVQPSSSFAEDLYALPQPPTKKEINGHPRPMPRSISSSNDLNGLTHDGAMSTDMFGNRVNADNVSSGSDHSSPALIRPSSSFDELKKSINELHKHNIIQQQQQQQQYLQHQQQMSYPIAAPAGPAYPVAAPAGPAYPANPLLGQQMGQQMPAMYASPVVQSPYPVAVASMQPGIPSRPGFPARPVPAPRPAPMMAATPATTANTYGGGSGSGSGTAAKSQTDMGWSGNILQPTPPPKPEPPKADPGVKDAFAFLDNRTNMDMSAPVVETKGPVMAEPMPAFNGSTSLMGTGPVVNGSTNANQELLDLFG